MNLTVKEKTEITVFHYGDGRSKKVLEECISDFIGTVESDGYNVYHTIAKESDDRIKNAGCLNHLRAKVMNALNTIDTSKMTPAQQKNVPAQVIVSKIDDIFQEEKKVKELKTAEERKKYRNDHVKKLFSELEDLFDKININELIVNSAMYKAVTYFNNQKEYLKVFLDDGNVCAQNSACEKAFALVALLRNQTKMISSRKGGICRAILESIEQTAANHVENIKHYYHYLIRRLPKFIDSYCVEHKTTHEKTDFSKVAEIDAFLPWSEEFIAYYKQMDNEEKNLLLSTL